MFSLIPSDANDPQGLMRRKETNKQTKPLPLLIYLLNVYQRPQQIHQKVIHGTMMNVK